MLRKPQEEAPKHSGNRVTLPEESGIRSITGFKEFLAIAQASKGNQIELSWITDKTGAAFCFGHAMGC